MTGKVCAINRCGREFGIGTHMSLTGDGRASDQVVKVCEEHWQALRPILPVEVAPEPEPEPEELPKLTLGQYLAAMEQMPADALVVFEKGGLVGPICSWRGRYSEPSVDTATYKGLTVMEVCADLRAVLAGKELDGWKGGEYVMREDQELWADASGTCDGRAVVGVVKTGSAIVTVQTQEHGW